jgi:hypothetical protein
MPTQGRAELDGYIAVARNSSRRTRAICRTIAGT